ncbi:ribokinase [Anaeromicrobium sediminis]|uniref:Ribokinase n=1 Tax=Anaeromicrobium sediminis TaxID=1478221 RepID=A0A267MLN6_9FIRM|nr:ribokinase [Anaeromicrobium sediminis]PAB60499.1 ribokinase [Anaeromicrobium sediminis]
MSKLVVLGSLNMDLVCTVKNMPKPGETLLGRDFSKIPGGKGANQVCAMARLGGQVSMIGAVGKDEFGTILKDSLKKDGANVDKVIEIDGVSTGVAMITVDDSGENSIVVVPGANYGIDEDIIENSMDIIKESSVAVTQLEVPLNVVEEFLVEAKKCNKYTILNPAPANVLSENIIKNIDLLTPNETELETITGIKIDSLEDVDKAAQHLLDMGVKEIIVTLGSKGCVYISKDTKKYYDAFKVDVVDTTAAGDSFTAAIAVGKIKGLSIDEAVEFATKVGALTVTKKGAQSSLPTMEEVNNFRR